MKEITASGLQSIQDLIGIAAIDSSGVGDAKVLTGQNQDAGMGRRGDAEICLCKQEDVRIPMAGWIQAHPVSASPCLRILSYNRARKVFFQNPRITRTAHGHDMRALLAEAEAVSKAA